MESVSIHHTIATLRMRSQVAKDDLKIAKARAEQDIISQLNGTYGKNAEERERQLTIGLSDHKAYQFVLHTARAYENDLLQAEADLAMYLDTRRQDEWAVRAALVNALEKRAIFTTGSEDSAEAVLDSEIDALVEQYARLADASDGMSGGNLNSDWYAGKPRPKPTYAALDESDYPF